MTHQDNVTTRAALTRRAFMQRSAGLGLAQLIPAVLGGAMGSVLTACSEVTDPTKSATIDLRTEPGVLNFLYAVLQLETDFYTRVVAARFPGMLASEFTTFRSALSSVSSARTMMMLQQIPAGRITDVVLFRVGQIVDYSDRTSVVTAAQTISDAAARGFLAAESLVHTSDNVTIVTTAASAAASRSGNMHLIAGTPPLTVTPQAPDAVMTLLAPYYLTTFTVRS